MASHLVLLLDYVDLEESLTLFWSLFLPSLQRGGGLGTFQIIDSMILFKNLHVDWVKLERLYLLSRPQRQVVTKLI